MGVVAACPTLQTQRIRGIEGKVTLIWLTIVPAVSGREAQCIQEHVSNPFSPQAVYHSISCLPRVWLPSIFRRYKFHCLSHKPPSKSSLFPSAHTYIHKHVFMEESVPSAHPEVGWIKIAFNSKQRIEALANRTDTGCGAQLCVSEKEISEKKLKKPGFLTINKQKKYSVKTWIINLLKVIYVYKA